MSFSSDGKFLVVGDDQAIYLWTTAGQLVGTLATQTQSLRKIALVQEHRQLLALDMQGMLKVWDVSALPLDSRTVVTNFHPRASISDAWFPVIRNSHGQQVFRIRQIDQLIAQGCDWLEGYFVAHANELTQYPDCQLHRR